MFFGEGWRIVIYSQLLMLLSIIKSSLLTKPFYSLAAVALGYLHGLEIPILKLEEILSIHIN